jgi:hypothetical protein
MTPTTTRRALLAGGAMLLASRTAAQQATALGLYSLNFEPDVAMLAADLPRRTGDRYQIEPIIGFDGLGKYYGQ